MIFSVVVSMTGGLFKVFALAVDASPSNADSMIPQVGLLNDSERGYGELTRKSRPWPSLA